MRGKKRKQKKPVKTLKEKFKGPSVQKLKSILDYRLTLEIREAFEEDTQRKRKHYRSVGFDDDYMDLMHRTIHNFYKERSEF